MSSALQKRGERYVARNPERIRSRQPEDVRIALVSKNIPRLPQRGIKQALIPQTIRTPMLRQLLAMRSQHRPLCNPPWLLHYSANLRSTSLFSRMIFRATAISSANSWS